MSYSFLRQHLSEYGSFSDEASEVVQAHFTERQYRRREIMIRQGERVTTCYFIVSGLVKLVYTDDSGKDHIVSFAREGWWESDFAAFFGHTGASMSLITLEPTKALTLSNTSYRTLCHEVPGFGQFALEKAHRGFIGAQQRILSLLTTSAKERYQRLIQNDPQLLQRVSKTQLAAYLGVSRETLSRLQL
ncbi:CRP-like cAMP-binding protein [Neolewinella xylanilytica]|uniref:CRP-like cAMP-binding protein n=1 Tax=Neolewinella xylanilytica TaxID=1514080 RepID=A0A2S6I4T4_9BACT|nr:Crp/Fnr family transcriptional regulator [Neolewinella xylanilytica]PPK86183.1 CRP-like cAMP-binding protein [Neolewinella xylanilytica]